MKPLILALGLSLAGAHAAHAMDEQTFHMVRGEIDGTQIDGADIFSWDGEAWIGGDTNRL